MTQTTPTVFDRTINFDPAGDFEAFLKLAPAKWVVYLLADEADRPVQLLCVKNLRYSLKRRLGGDETIGGLSRRVDYREIVRRIHWRRVDSAFEADWLYYEAARTLFPQTYQGMVGFRPAWFVHVNPETDFPRFTKTIDLSKQTGRLFGPVEDKHAAGKMIELVEDAFDLCRYYNILVESPNAKACAYKEMGKCPAPCDGSISMSQYRQLMRYAISALDDPAEFAREQERRMAAAAAELRFETAGKIKQYVDQLKQLGKGPLRHVRPVEEFAFLSLQRGPSPASAKVFLVRGGAIEEILDVTGIDFNAGQVLRVALERAAAAERPDPSLDSAGVERIGIVAHHLFSAKTGGVLLRMSSIDEKAVARAYRELQKQPEPAEIEGEGVLKELQSL
jgi:excinuclease UvrABC nuclease subunit